MSATRQPPSPAAIMPSGLDLIGNTPLVALDRVHAGPGRILAKAELMKPNGSVKDRVAPAVLCGTGLKVLIGEDGIALS